MLRVRKLHRVPGIVLNIRAEGSREGPSKRLTAQTPADHLLKRLPGNVNSRPHTERVDLATLQPAVKRGARNRPARSSAKDPPGVWRREQRRVLWDFTPPGRVAGNDPLIKHF